MPLPGAAPRRAQSSAGREAAAPPFFPRGRAGLLRRSLRSRAAGAGLQQRRAMEAAGAAGAAAGAAAQDAAEAEAPPTGAAAAAPRRLLALLRDKMCTWHILKTILLGQILSLFICGTAVTSQYLAEQYQVNTPMFQSFINYSLLLLVYTTMLAFRTGGDSLLQILKQRWWKYIFLGLADVEANYMIVKAYQYTTLTSVQLLDCFGIPVLMALSWFILRARYRLIHFIAVAVCLLGVGTMVGADILAGRQDSEGSDVVIGDVLVLLGASLYAISNMSEEYIVKNLSRVEFLGMVGLFGTIISGLQLAIVEHRDIMKIQWNWKIALLFIVFALCMFGLYSFMPVVIKVTSATSVNLGILTADLYSLFFGLFLFYYKFSGLYILSFVIIMVGFILYCSTPTHTAEPTTVPQPCSAGLDNAALKLDENDSATPAVTVQFMSGESVVVSTD
ncbi:solute carrier family 35 member F2 isoform X2 [Numida meleagris]|uniref:solute carrier family 35 member F2 isoform X2 n=1 Tax=Numida meleagris TaxID=8996 RepID=UPI000B3DE17F|nr:solute carrier family 35 member F2 isoform X2 [Numida meleagris]